MGRQKRADRAAVLAYARTQRDRLAETADAVRADEPDAVHRMRVAARRLRSVLRTYPSVFPTSDADPIRDELRWLGTILGEARDAEVLADRFAGTLDGLDPDLVRGPVRYRLVDARRARYASARTASVEALDDPRYRRLLTDLDALFAHPGDSGSPRSQMRRAHRRVLRAGRIAGLRGKGGAPGPPEALHTTRKRAKALRYAAEALTESRPRSARIAVAAERLQTVLGEHHDAVVAREQTLTEANRARAAGEDTFSYGVVAASETVAADRAAAAARPEVAAIRDLRR